MAMEVNEYFSWKMKSQMHQANAKVQGGNS